MKLETKPDFEDVKQRWNAFWNDEVLDRPMVCAMAPKDGGRDLVNIMGPRYWNACEGNYDAQLDLLAGKGVLLKVGTTGKGTYYVLSRKGLIKGSKGS